MAQPKVRSVSSILVKTEQLQLQCSVSLFDMTTDELSPISFFRKSQRNIYMTSNPHVTLRLKYVPKEKKMELDKNLIASITPLNIHGLRMVLNTFFDRYQRDDMFTYDEHGRAESINAHPGDILNYSLDDTHTIQLRPIIYRNPTRNLNELSGTSPGIGLILNFKQNLAILTVDEFMWLKSTIDEFNFATYGHMLLLEYLMFAKQAPVQEKSFITQEDDGILQKAFGKSQASASPNQVSQKPIINRNPTLEDL